MKHRPTPRSSRRSSHKLLLVLIAFLIVLHQLFSLHHATIHTLPQQHHLANSQIQLPPKHGPPHVVAGGNKNNNGTSQLPPTWKIPKRDDNNSTYSACLLIADDNHFLMEWIAYHYTTLPLRYLIVARDPRSRTSPKFILDRWEPYMTIERWNDKRFLPPEWLNRVPAENDPIAKLMKHRERQRNFYPACFEHLQAAGRQWVMVVDVDEFVVQNAHYQPKLQNGMNTSTNTSTTLRAPPPTHSYPTFLQAIQDQAPYNASNTSCITMPRLRFGNFDNISATATATATHPLALAPPPFDDTSLLTYRYRWRAALHNKKINRHPKSTIRVDRIDTFSRQETDAHRPVRSACPRENLYIANVDSPFVVHHYVGSKEQFKFRKDARDGTKTRSDEQLEAYGQIYEGYDTTASSWLPALIEQMGMEKAQELLKGVGNTTYQET